LKRRISPFLLAAAALIAATAFLLVRSSPTSAHIELRAGTGSAVWFFRACNDVETTDVAVQTVALDTTKYGQKSLRINIGNAYPGYQLRCELYLANNGNKPIQVNSISVFNLNPGDLTIKAVENAGDQDKTLKPCGFTPEWGTQPNKVPLSCRTKINFNLSIGPGAEQDARMYFGILMHLGEKYR